MYIKTHILWHDDEIENIFSNYKTIQLYFFFFISESTIFVFSFFHFLSIIFSFFYSSYLFSFTFHYILSLPFQFFYSILLWENDC
uniref:Uncharacterized protein n=1 Tax=Strongyloides papillosus TaxID=174720 RepID=A0A0N5BUK9_STREA